MPCANFSNCICGNSFSLNDNGYSISHKKKKEGALVMSYVEDYYYLFIFLKEQNYSKISHVRYLSPLYMLVPTKIKKKVSW
jgi:hypothetical protein